MLKLILHSLTPHLYTQTRQVFTNKETNLPPLENTPHIHAYVSFNLSIYCTLLHTPILSRSHYTGCKRSFIVTSQFSDITAVSSFISPAGTSVSHLVVGDLFFLSQWTASKNAAFQNLNVCLSPETPQHIYNTNQVGQ